jgi:filamentous hemagglutinin
LGPRIYYGIMAAVAVAKIAANGVNGDYVGGGTATGGGATRATGTVWDAIKATQPVYEGTAIPRSFELATASGKIWVHGNATKHMAEYAKTMLGRGVGSELVNLGSQQQLRGLQAAVETAIANGVPYNTLLTVGGWELKFAAPRAEGQLPVLIHALAQ